MDSTIVGAIIGFIAAILAQVIQRLAPSPPPNVAVTVNVPEHEHPAVIHRHKRSWVDTLKSLIRPIITLAFFALFAGVKIYALYHGIHYDDAAVGTILPVVWDEGTGELLGLV